MEKLGQHIRKVMGERKANIKTIFPTMPLGGSDLLESRPQDALVKLVETVETVKTENLVVRWRHLH